MKVTSELDVQRKGSRRRDSVSRILFKVSSKLLTGVEARNDRTRPGIEARNDRTRPWSDSIPLSLYLHYTLALGFWFY